MYATRLPRAGRLGLLERIRRNLDRFSARFAISAAFLVVLVTSIIATTQAPTELSKSYLAFAILLAGAVLVLQCVYRATGPKPVNWFSVDVLFVITYCLLHFTFVTCWVLDAMPAGMQPVWAKPATADHVCYATMLSVSALAIFAIGFNLLPDRYAQLRKPVALNRTALRKWKTLGNALMLAGIITTLLFLVLYGNLAFGGPYKGSTFPSRFANIIYLLARMLFSIGAVVLTIAAGRLSGKWKIGLLAKTAAVVFAAGVLIHGDRSAAALFLFVVAAVYMEEIRHLSFTKFLVTATIAIMAFGLLRITRQQSERSVSTAIKTVKEEGLTIWQSAIWNAASSVQTLYVAVDYVPEIHDYYYGKLKITDALRIVPFLGGLGPRMGPHERSSSTLLTWRIMGIPYTPGGPGKGTSINADMYLDFGFPGVLVALFLLGIMSKYIQQKARSSGSITWEATHCFLIAAMVLISRYGMVFHLIREVLWPVAFTVALGVSLGISRRIAIHWQVPSWGART